MLSIKNGGKTLKNNRIRNFKRIAWYSHVVFSMSIDIFFLGSLLYLIYSIVTIDGVWSFVLFSIFMIFLQLFYVVIKCILIPLIVGVRCPNCMERTRTMPLGCRYDRCRVCGSHYTKCPEFFRQQV